jgi:hypothetical protein
MKDGNQRETRERIEAALRKRLEQARKEFERWKADTRKLAALGADVAGTPDGALTLQKSLDALENANLAHERYEAALSAFTEFILKGRFPADLDLGEP